MNFSDGVVSLSVTPTGGDRLSPEPDVGRSFTTHSLSKRYNEQKRTELEGRTKRVDTCVKSSLSVVI